MRGEGGLNSQPAHVAVSTPYINPVETRENVVRSTPPRTLGWVDSLTMDRFGIEPQRFVAAGGRMVPRVSEDRNAELLIATVDRTVVLLWLHAPGPDVSAATLRAGGVEIAVERIEMLDVPADAYRELQLAGYPGPPRKVALLTAGPLPEGADAVEISFDRGAARKSDRIDSLPPRLAS